MTRREHVTHRSPPEVHTITDAQSSRDADLARRMRKYLISMSVRTVCFVLAVVFDGWIRWVFAAAAIVLPYIAVVIANAGPRREPGHSPYTPAQHAVDDGHRGRLGS